MIYRSTRSNDWQVSAAQAIIQGLAPDGGLFVPAEFPSAFTEGKLKDLFNLSYQELAEKVLSRFLRDTTNQECH